MITGEMILSMSKAANLFIENGLESDLYTLENKSIDLCLGVITYLDEYKKYPAITDKNPYVRKLANWLTSMRAAHSNKSKRVIYPSVIKIVENSNYPNLFDKTKNRGVSKSTMTANEYYLHRVQKTLKKFNEVIKFTEDNNRYPYKIELSRKNEYSEEFYNKSNRLCNWISSMRQATRTNNANILYPALTKAVKNSNYPNIFNSNWKDDFK